MSIRGLGAVIAAMVAVVAGVVTIIAFFHPTRGQGTGSSDPFAGLTALPEYAPFIFSEINHKSSKESPDFARLRNQTAAKVSLSGYQLCQRKPGLVSEKCCEIPSGIEVAGGDEVAVYCFSPKKPANINRAQKYEKSGHIVCKEFGISISEIVVLRDEKGALVARRQAS